MAIISKKSAIVSAIVLYGKIVNNANAGDLAGLLLKGIDKSEILPGQVIVQPGSIEQHSYYRAIIYALSVEEGCHFPIASKKPMSCYLNGADNPSVAEFDGSSEILPGHYSNATIRLLSPQALKTGTRFALRENGKTLAAGIVVESLDQ